jgi:hypothetical protein
VGTTDTQTLTNKTLGSGLVAGASIITSGTVVASTSGTSITFTSIPSWVKRVTVMLNGVSSNSTGSLQVQLGTGGAATITGYNSMGAAITSGTLSSVANSTTGFGVNNEGATAAATRSGTFVFTNITGNVWLANIQYAFTDTTRILWGAGTVTLSGVLDTIRIIASATGSPADTFDAGSINILYE